MIRTKPTPYGLEILVRHGLPAAAWGALVPSDTSVRGVMHEWAVYLYSTEDAMRAALAVFAQESPAVAPWLGFTFRAIPREDLRRLRPDFGRVTAWVWVA
jgi:hypothetical protein